LNCLESNLEMVTEKSLLQMLHEVSPAFELSSQVLMQTPP